MGASHTNSFPMEVFFRSPTLVSAFKPPPLPSVLLGQGPGPAFPVSVHAPAGFHPAHDRPYFFGPAVFDPFLPGRPPLPSEFEVPSPKVVCCGTSLSRVCSPRFFDGFSRIVSAVMTCAFILNIDLFDAPCTLFTSPPPPVFCWIK